jgi:glucose/arabinose dehydrogenase
MDLLCGRMSSHLLASSKGDWRRRPMARVSRSALFLLATTAAFGVLPGCRSLDWVQSGGNRRGGDYGSGAEPQNFSFQPNDQSCAGYPRLRIETMDKMCIGLVAQNTKDYFRPRVILPIPMRANEYLITDHANFSDTDGKIWYLKDNGAFNKNSLKIVLRGLSLPHQIALGPGSGPDQLVLFGESHEINAFPVSAIGADGTIAAGAIKTVVSGLPPFYIGERKNSVHPISHFVLDEQFNLYVNVGSFSDHCSDNKGSRCIESSLNVSSGNGGADLAHAGAVIRRYAYQSNSGGGWDSKFSVVAQGLRNSMGLMFSAGGDLIQLENSRDFPESQRPYEELNVIPKSLLAGSSAPPHYGWPYCYDAEKTSDEWKEFQQFNCTDTQNASQLAGPNGEGVRYVPPYILLPPHGAPLGILQYTGSLLPALTGKLLVPLHGYRPAGHRIVAFDLNEDQQSSQYGLPVRSSEPATFRQDSDAGGTEPAETRYELGKSASEESYTAQSIDVVGGWYESPGVRPQGAPVALTQVSDGSIWIADDKSGSILRLAATDQGPLPVAPRPDFASAYTSLVQALPEIGESAKRVSTDLFQSNHCAGCHDDFRLPRDGNEDGLAGLRYVLALGGWVNPGEPDESVLLQKLLPAGQSPMPPPDYAFQSQQDAEAAANLVSEMILKLPARELIFQNEGTQPVSFRNGGYECGSLPVGQAVAVASRQAQKLGGELVLKLQISALSKLISKNIKLCEKSSTFYAPADSLTPLMKDSP